ncbi:SGNH/GDSL hydrolase family protein [Pseudoduganella sp. UC29_106]|uniref:SGNH/GDSL hydrolase family protein n=1 Tax=Pseudoduganella sp. UC29_106 TaxID=3374553 RepID=UPI0037564A7D
MKLVLSLAAAAVIAACGGNGPREGDQTPKQKYSAMISFGDSLSDVGTYAVGSIKAAGGGKFTINGNNTAINEALTGSNWTELIAAQVGLPAPCPYMTGLEGDASKGLNVPISTNNNCNSYAQGGSRVTNPIGPHNKANDPTVGALTVPVVTQVKNHLAKVGGKFKGDELVLMMVGGNDVLQNLDDLRANATKAGTAAGNTTFATSLTGQLAAGAPSPQTAAQAIGLAIATEAARPGSTSATIVGAGVAAAVAAGNTSAASPAVYGPMVAKAQADATAAGAKAGADYAAAHGPELVVAMGQAGAELVVLVKSQLIANGANFVVVNNLPDVANTPSGLAQDANTKALINAMVKAFNDQLTNGLAAEAKVQLVDVFYVSHDQATNPAPYGLTNVTEPACDLSPAKNITSSSLTCNASNLKPGDVSHYSYADTVHPTPFNNKLLARYVSEKMALKGWM